MTHFEVLKSNSSYPIDESVIDGMALRRGLDLTIDASKDSLQSDPFRLTEADVLVWLANAPNVTEGGVSFDILYSTRTAMKAQAQAVYDELEGVSDDSSDDSDDELGYIGDSL